MYFDKSLEALKSKNRFRERKITNENILDFSSNDYLGLASNVQTFDKAIKTLKQYKIKAPKSSMLVGGYHPIHQRFEDHISRKYGFEESIVVGSGYLANIALLEALPRKGDLLILDEKYHASGVMASKLTRAKVEFFTHNDTARLRQILQTNKYKKSIIAVEGIYSMDGDMMDMEIFDIADEFDSLLIVDEAHSMGVIGKSLGGVFEGVEPKPNHIKMGTLGKALGSYGAYISASSEVVSYLQNRAKSIIYTTAPSLFDIELGYQNIKYIEDNHISLATKRDEIKQLIFDTMGTQIPALILPIAMDNNLKCLQAQDMLLQEGFSVGAIRPPTVSRAILRIIPRVSNDISHLRQLLSKIELL